MFDTYQEDYDSAPELDFSDTPYTRHIEVVCPICGEPEYKHQTAKNRCELCANQPH